MQKYVIVGFIEKVAEGQEFTVSTWPLHVTLASNFILDIEGTHFLEKLGDLLTGHGPITTKAGDDEFFGDQKQIHVTLVDKNDELVKLHNEIVALLKELGATFDEPHYQEENYKPHVTVRSHDRVHKNDEITINSLSLVDMFLNQDIRGRKTLRTINL